MYKAVVIGLIALIVLSGVYNGMQTERESEPVDESIELVLLSQSATANAVETVREPERTHGEEHTLPPETTAVKVEPVKYYWDVNLSHKLQDYIRKLCEQYDVPMALVLAIIKHESNFNPNEISPTNDYGLMQINSGSFSRLEKELGRTDINWLDPYDNILCGIHSLARHIRNADGNLIKGVLAYNKGDGGMRALWDSGVRSTHYTERVFYYFRLYSSMELDGETK